MGKEARIKAARKNERGTMPGAWALNSKNNFRRRTKRRIYALVRPVSERLDIAKES